MAASAILAKFLSVVTPTISLGSLANAAGRISAEIDNTVVKATKGFFAVKIKAGSTPTVNTLLKFYLIRNSGDATNIQAGMMSASATPLGAVDAAVATEPTNAELLGTIAVSATTGVTYQEVFKAYDPGPKFSIVVWNATGQALDATGGSHLVQWVPIVDEAQ